MNDLFKNNGIKKTEQREKLLKIIKNSKVPLTAEDIFKKTKEISLATIYRTLETFCEKGVLNKISVTDDERKYYELATDIHRHYAVCLKCKKMEYVNVCPVHDVNLDGFRITGHRLELYGYCNNCSEG